MGRFVLLSAMALVVASLFLLLRGGGASAPPVEGGVAREVAREGDGEMAEVGGTLSLAPRLEATANLVGPLDEPRQGAEERGLRFALVFEAVERGTQEPVPGVTLLLSASGTRDRGLIAGTAHRAVTGADGGAVFDELPGRGPWDVHVHSYVPSDDPAHLLQARRACTATAQPLLDPSTPLPPATRVEIGLGARVVLRSLVPPGVAPSDLLFELLVDPSPASSQLGRRSEYARGTRSPKGYVEARFHPIQNKVHGNGFTVTVVSSNGLHALTHRGDVRLDPRSPVEIDEPFERMGRVAFRLEIDANERNVPDGALARAASQVMFVANDGSMDELFGPSSWLLGRCVPLGGELFELHALPLVPGRLVGRSAFGAATGRPGEITGPSADYEALGEHPVTPGLGAQSPVAFVVRRKH